MVLFLLRSAGSPWNLLRCGRRWTTSSSADCACRMQQPKAFVFRQLIFGINANPHYKSFARFVCDSVWPRRGLLAVCGTYFARHRAVVDFLPLLSLPFFCFVSSMLGHEAYVFGRPSDFSSRLGGRKAAAALSKSRRLPRDDRLGDRVELIAAHYLSQSSDWRSRIASRRA